jgi:type II secretory pathway pseudopilin PulG
MRARVARPARAPLCREGGSDVVRRRSRAGAGYSLVELAVLLGVIAIVAALAAPSLSQGRSNQRLRDVALSLAGALHHARSEAIRTGNVHAVFYQTDAQGVPLTDDDGDPVLALVLDDGRPGAAGQNCAIDAGETITALAAESGIAAGPSGSPGAAPTDLGSGDIDTGSSFTEPGGSDASWVLFRPDGAPVAFDSSCNLGPLGSGAGAFYLGNGSRTAAVVLMPTGATRVHTHAGAWSE